jgi:DNA anti-recombination protein RmuC
MPCLNRNKEGNTMSELENPPRSYSGAFLAAVAIALLSGLGGLVWSYTLGSRLSHQEAALTDATQQNVKLAAELRETNARLTVATDELGKSLGLTQKQMESRAQEIIAQQNASARKLEAEQKQTASQVSSVSSDLTNVKTDVGGVKTDLGKTQTDLATAIAQLTSMKGDLTDHTSLIARNHDELEVLKHKGDRNYYEFTLQKGQRKPVGTVSLELKKADQKKNRFTLVIFSDDKAYEKKDRNVNEPLQFYAGREPMLYEVVVNNIQSKNQISGYLSTPKSAPVPAAIGQ